MKKMTIVKSAQLDNFFVEEEPVRQGGSAVTISWQALEDAAREYVGLKVWEEVDRFEIDENGIRVFIRRRAGAAVSETVQDG